MVIGICFIIGISSLYFVTDEFRSNYDIANVGKWQEDFYSNDFNPNKNQIFLLGSSHTARANATLVQEIIVEKFSNYEVYNLAMTGDKPSERLLFMDELITTNPEIVVYGIDIRHMYVNPGSTSTNQLSIPVDENGFFPKVQFFNNISLDKKIFGIDLKNFENPKLISLKIINYITGKEYARTYNKDTNHPFVPEAPVYRVVNEKQLQDDLKTKPFILQNGPDREVQKDSLKKIIKKLKENNIEVIIFITPHHRSFVDSLPVFIKYDFFSFLQSISDEYDVTVVNLLDKYDDENVWENLTHLAGSHPNSVIYNKDIAEMIVKEIEG